MEALRLLATKKFTLILLDLHVRLIDGFVILHTLGAKPGPNKDTPVYVMSADVSEHSRLRALREHAVFVLNKPVSISTVTNLVDAGLKKASMPPSEGRPEGSGVQAPEPRPEGVRDAAPTGAQAGARARSPTASRPRRGRGARCPTPSRPRRGRAARAPFPTPSRQRRGRAARARRPRASPPR